MGSRETAAQQPGFGLDRYEPSERGSDWFSVESLDLRGHLRPALGLVVDGAYRPLAIYGLDGNVAASIVEHQIFAHVGGSLTLWDRLRVGLSLPVAVYQTGDSGALNGVAFTPPSSAQGVGDLRLSADVRLLGEYGTAFTLAVGARLFIPTGSRAGFTGDEAVRVEGRFAAAGDIGIFTYAARLGAQYRGLSDAFAGSPLGSEFVFGAAAGLRLADKKLVIGPEVYGSTVMTDGAAFKTRSTPLEGLLGLHYTIAKDFKLGLAGGPGLTRGYGSPVARWLLSFEWAPAYESKPLDRDHDGVLDNDDACPDVPGVKTDDPKTNGCPPPPADRDGDGVLDKDDACIDVPGVKTDDPKTNGCPADRDHDGIYDKDDACPDVPGVKTDDPKTNGCPPDRDHDGIYDKDDACPDVPGVKTDDPKTNGCPSDRDHDGVPDNNDACPDVPGLKTSDPKTNGCPLDPDRDKDSIPNDQDACPDEPGPKNADPKKNGCPQAVVRQNQIVILEQVKFAPASAVILPASTPVLDAVTKILQDHTEIKKLSVEGHTDNQGPAAYNKQLSAQRAASVVNWLVAHGIDRARLSSQGFGMEKPIDTNATAPGRQNNRRVEFHIGDAAAPPP